MDSGTAGRQSKRAKSGEAPDVACNIDRLGILPDGILRRILSLLPMQDAVRTGLIARRWRNLWISIPILVLSDWRFPQKSMFMNFVERTLLLRDSSSLEKFSLSCSGVESDAYRIKSWTTAIVRRNVQELSLRFWTWSSSRGLDALPPCLFRCQTLVKLRLDVHHNFILPSPACLPSLKDLELVRLRFVDGSSVHNLFSSSPALAILTIKDCHWKGQNDVTISAPNLQILSIADCSDHGSAKVIIYGPNVKSFGYSSNRAYPYCLVGSSSLTEARLSFRNPPYTGESDGFSNMLRSFSNVRSLTLSGALFLGIPSEEDLLENLPTFCNMKELKLDMLPVFLGSKGLATLLGKCPYLRILEIAEGFVEGITRAPVLAPPCFQSQLKKIVVHNVSLDKDNVDCVAFLLSKATALEEMVLYYDGSIEDAHKVPELMRLPRGSRKCKISLIL